MCDQQQDDELVILKRLTQEPLEWLRGDGLLAGLTDQHSHRPPVFRHFQDHVQINVVAASRLNELASFGSEDDIARTLREELEELEAIFFRIHSDSSDAMRQAIDDATNQIRHVVAEKEVIVDLGYALCEFNEKRKRKNRAWVLGNVMTHFVFIAYMRFVTLGRRCFLTECLNYSYRLGLYPFGWDHETMWCLDPSHLE